MYEKRDSTTEDLNQGQHFVRPDTRPLHHTASLSKECKTDQYIIEYVPVVKVPNLLCPLKWTVPLHLNNGHQHPGHDNTNPFVKELHWER